MSTELSSNRSLADSANPLDRYVYEYFEIHAHEGAGLSRPHADLVNLTENSLAGANALLQQRAKLIEKLRVADFPYALRKLTASQLEDFLCTYGEQIVKFTTTDWIRVDRDWRGT